MVLDWSAETPKAVLFQPEPWCFAGPTRQRCQKLIPCNSAETILEIRPYRGGWQCYEGPGVAPYWIGENAKEDAIGYAKARAKYGHSEIRVLKDNGSVESVIRV